MLIGSCPITLVCSQMIGKYPLFSLPKIYARKADVTQFPKMVSGNEGQKKNTLKD
jgi:hypothetical protein